MTWGAFLSTTRPSLSVTLALPKSTLPAGMILSCVTAAALAAVLYTTLGGLLFPAELVDRLVPSGQGSRFLWTMLSAALIALAIGFGGLRPQVKEQAP